MLQSPTPTETSYSLGVLARNRIQVWGQIWHGKYGFELENIKVNRQTGLPHEIPQAPPAPLIVRKIPSQEGCYALFPPSMPHIPTLLLQYFAAGCPRERYFETLILSVLTFHSVSLEIGKRDSYLEYSVGTPEVAQLVTNMPVIYSRELTVGFTTACCSDHHTRYRAPFNHRIWI
ncbi:hypothetical protein BKA83DRAFT_4480726 [Pisolithus microcarpus]|nr:hypothetical protein BKA83DRAFT_4480726 [Pisolithus microcarpus]